MNNEYGITPAEIEDGKTMGGIAYFGLLGFLIAFLTKRENKYVMYHAQQSLIIVICLLVVAIPVIGWLIGIGAFVLFIIGMLNGFKGEIKPLPMVGNLALKFGILKPEGGDTPPAPPAAPGSPDVE